MSSTGDAWLRTESEPPLAENMEEPGQLRDSRATSSVGLTVGEMTTAVTTCTMLATSTPHHGKGRTKKTPPNPEELQTLAGERSHTP